MSHVVASAADCINLGVGKERHFGLDRSAAKER
jgi:hypothetical protein